jgi:F-type H+-transporting ATPase subunit c
MTSRRVLMIGMLLLAVLALPAMAQDNAAATPAGGGGMNLGIIGAAIAIGVAAAGGAVGQGKAVSAACSAMARNP